MDWMLGVFFLFISVLSDSNPNCDRSFMGALERMDGLNTYSLSTIASLVMCFWLMKEIAIHTIDKIGEMYYDDS